MADLRGEHQALDDGEGAQAAKEIDIVVREPALGAMLLVVDQPLQLLFTPPSPLSRPSSPSSASTLSSSPMPRFQLLFGCCRWW